MAKKAKSGGSKKGSAASSGAKIVAGTEKEAAPEAKLKPETKPAVEAQAKAESKPESAPKSKSKPDAVLAESKAADKASPSASATTQAAQSSKEADNVSPADDKNVEPAAVSTPAATPSVPSKIVVGLAMTVLAVGIVGSVYLFTLVPHEQDLPYLLDPLEKHLDKNVRYKAPHLPENKDWRSEFATEQFIWRGELSKMMLGASDAKPIEFKRDFMLYLADSFFHDEPHFEDAKAAYLNASATKRVPHERAFDYSDDELWRRIAYCDMRLGLYDEADLWLKKALAINEEEAKSKPSLESTNIRNRIIDNMAENYARKGEPKLAEELIAKRLKDMRQDNPDFCIELPVLHALALTKMAEGDNKKAEHFFDIAVKLCDAEDSKRGVVPNSPSDNNRSLARVLMDYSHLLRIEHRNDQAVALMHRALGIYDNAPP